MLSRLLAYVFGRTGEHQTPSASPEAADQTAQDREFQLLNRFAPIKGAEGGHPAADRNSRHEAAPASVVPALRAGEGRPAAGQKPEQIYVCREAVLNRGQRVAGYEFMLRKGTRQRMRQAGPALLRLYDEVLIRNLVNMQLDRLLGHRLAFLGILASSLRDRLVEMLPAEGTVLIVRSIDGLPEGFEDLLERIKELKRLGFRIALEELADSPGTDALLEIADFVMVDVAAHDFPHIRGRVEAATRKSMNVQLIARNVESIEAFEACGTLPFQYFQGPFVTRREQWEQPKSDANQTRLLELLNLARQDAETVDLVKVFKQDAILSFKLLRYINSPAGGLLTKVTSMEHALVVMGRQRLYRWLTLLLFSSGATDERCWALLENVLVRARLAETLARERFSPAQLDDLFVVGMFSLLDVLMHVPMERVLAQLTLPESVTEALLCRTGKYAPYLELAIACEAFDQDRIAALAAVCGLDEQRVNVSHIEALIWAQQVQM